MASFALDPSTQSDGALPLGMTNEQSYRVIVESVRALAGHQVVTSRDAWIALTGLSVDKLDEEESHFLRWVLEELGYELEWVTEVGQTKFLHRWTRGPWPIDFGANVSRPITMFVSN